MLVEMTNLGSVASSYSGCPSHLLDRSYLMQLLSIHIGNKASPTFYTYIKNFNKINTSEYLLGTALVLAGIMATALSSASTFRLMPLKK